MTRPENVNGPFGSPTQQWAWPASPAGRQFPDPASGAQPPYPAYQQAYQPYPPQQAYPSAWAQPARPFPSAPIAPAAAPRPGTGPSAGRILVYALVGILMGGLLGGALLLLTGNGTIDGTVPGGAPSVASPAAQVVTMSLPPVVDGHPQIDDEYSRQLVDAAKQQLAAVTPNPVVGMYGDPGQPPAFVVIAGTTTSGDPDLVLTGMAAGFQQSLGVQGLEFVDQPAGPLGGTMRCAQQTPMTTCMWTVDGAFGMNMVFQQDLAQAAETTLRVRDAIEVHAS
jgi:hypothetical protein